MPIEELIAEKQRIQSDSTLDPAEKKKLLRKLRKQIRKAPGFVKQPRAPRLEADGSVRVKNSQARQLVQAVDMKVLVKAVEDMVQDKKLKHVSIKTEPGYGFPLFVCAGLGISDPQVLVDKFKSRWGIEPKQYDMLKFEKEVLFLLGPTTGPREVS